MFILINFIDFIFIVLFKREEVFTILFFYSLRRTVLSLFRDLLWRFSLSLRIWALRRSGCLGLVPDLGLPVPSRRREKPRSTYSTLEKYHLNVRSKRKTNDSILYSSRCTYFTFLSTSLSLYI